MRLFHWIALQMNDSVRNFFAINFGNVGKKSVMGSLIILSQIDVISR